MPKKLLEGDTPRLIDEWQVAPQLWDAARFEADHRNEDGQFIFTSSTTPADTSKINHSGTGRFARITMRPMSLYEDGSFTGEVSLEELFTTPSTIKGTNKLELSDITYLICRGGWPKSINREKDTAFDSAYDYYISVVNFDISKVDKVKRNPERVKVLMKSYARNQASQATNTTLVEDMIENDNSSLSEDTVYSYINALKNIFVIEETPAWNPNLRSKTAIRTTNTRFFVDPSIATAALGIGSNDLENDLNTLGLMFETLCIRDLRVYADVINGQVYHYRDASDLECDAVIHLRNDNYGLIEIKIGGNKLIEEGVATLNKLANKLDTTKMKKPLVRMLIEEKMVYILYLLVP